MTVAGDFLDTNLYINAVNWADSISFFSMQISGSTRTACTPWVEDAEVNLAPRLDRSGVLSSPRCCLR